MPTHNQLIDSVDNIISNGVQNQTLHLTSRGNGFDGKHFNVNGKNLVGFASYSYLNLDQEPELIKGMIEAAQQYGTQFPLSRAYMQLEMYEEFEDLLSQIFGAPTLVGQSTTAIHQATIPTLVRNEDVVILDHQVHGSVQVTVERLKTKGIPVELLRHNMMDRLEERIKLHIQKDSKRKIWYFADGVYSMYGDFAPVHELVELMDKYPQLMVYIDDAHGLSWIGEHGAGYVLSEIDLHPQLILVSSLNKAFAGLGGTVTFPTQEMYRRVRTCGETQIFSTQIPPANMGCNVVSAKLHLSKKIELYQDALQRKIKICQKAFSDSNLPVVDFNNSPIFYVGVGKPKVGNAMMARLINEGFYSTIGMFPAVATKNTGLRVCINRKNQESDIKNLAKAIEYHLPYALAENNSSIEEVHKAFKMDAPKHKNLTIDVRHINSTKKITLEEFDTIKDVNKKEWNKLLGNNGTFDWDGLLWLEESHKNNAKKESNWDFKYFILKDEKQQVVLATFCTKAWCKLDIFHHSYISAELEKERKNDPYYLCSEMLMLGSLLTAGEHMYLNKELNWKDGLHQLLMRFNELQHEYKVNQINLRDFIGSDEELKEYMIDEGYVPVDLPDSHSFTKLGWKDIEEFKGLLSKKSRRYLKQQIINYTPMYDISIEPVKKQGLKQLYELYLNVKDQSKEVNSFDVPFKAFEKMVGHKNWELITLRLNEDAGVKDDNPVACMFCYKGDESYTPLLVGLNYQYLDLKVYKQILFQTIKRGNDLGYKLIHLGYSATIEKQRLGSEVSKTTGFSLVKDMFDLKELENKSISEWKRDWEEVKKSV